MGGGIIGLELGCVYQNFGTEVTVVEALPQVLTGVDPDLARIVSRRMTKAGTQIYTQAKALSAKKTAKGVEVVFEVKGAQKKVTVDCVLVAVGFRPNSQGLGLEAAGVQVDERGFISVDERLRSNVENVFAIGDVTGPPLLAHRASKQGEVAAEVIAGKPTAWDVTAIPSAIFTQPEIATVGLTETEAKEKGLDIKVGKFPFLANSRARANADTDGLVKILADAKTDRVLGVHILGGRASEMLAEAVLAMEFCSSAEDIALTMHAHPTLPEAMKEAALAVSNKAIHM